MQLLHNATTPRCSDLRCCATLPQLAWLSSTVASMTRYLHHADAKSPRQCRCQHGSTSLLSARLGIYITPRPSRPGSIVASMTRQRYHQQDSAVSSPAWLGSIVASMTWHQHHAMTWSSTSTRYDFSGKQTCCQLIPILFTIMFGFRANASVSMCCLASLWSISISKTYIWRL
jgi:hypothetical protein